MAEILLAHSYLVLLMPLAGFLVIGLWLGRTSPLAAGRLAVALAGVNLAFGLLLAFGAGGHLFATPGVAGQPLIPVNFDWLNFTPALTARLSIYLDPLSVVMMVVVMAIALPVMIYSMGYMRGDRGYGRFFALLSLFVFAMLGLTLAGNIFQLFVFWELVGVSSYFLIGFWYQKPEAVAASKKAFLITRFADAFFLLGIITLSFYAGSFDFAVLNDPATAEALNRQLLPWGPGVPVLTVATLLIFIGGWGKSAMFPLHVWLPDAMEGPTPVSSIIHSATMVVAGVFLTARMFPLFVAADFTMEIVLLVGGFTALFAAVIAITQLDIKRILAFSTLSQLGYMMFSLGAAKMVAGAGVNSLAYSAAIFHIFTHAFFKCLLFLGAGVVIHAVHHNSLSHMGGLRRQLPLTYWSMLIACLAISGIYPLAGFWSKDAILLAAWQSGHYLTFGVGLLVGGLTALYMFRFLFLIFHGQRRHEPHAVIHEEPLMAGPIVILAVPSILAGIMGEHFFVTNIVPPLTPMALAGGLPHPGWLPVAAGLTGLAGLLFAWLLYGRGSVALAGSWRQRLGGLHTLVSNEFYIDEVYLFVTRRLIFDGVASPIKWFDRRIVDGAMDATGWLLQRGGAGVRLAQNGLLSLYLGMIILGVVFLFIFGGFPF
jgi:NADH-quinone oxidoreductase subunit L